MAQVRTVAIIQARCGSTRYPKKVLADLNGASVLQRVIDRVKRASLVDAVCVATTAHAADDEVARIAEERGAWAFRDRRADDVFGPGQNDVLLRFLWAAQHMSAERVVRVTADCPLIDPEVIDKAVHALTPQFDFVSNAIQRTYPRGLDVEVAWMDVVRRLDRLANTHPDREHVFTYIYRTAPTLFHVRHLRTHPDMSGMNWCVDHPADIERIRAFWEDTDHVTLVAKVIKMAERAA